MFSTVGIIIVAILTGGSLIALFGFFGPLTRDILAILPFIVFVGCVSFILLIASNILKTILSVPSRRKNNKQIKNVVDANTTILNDNNKSLTNNIEYNQLKNSSVVKKEKKKD